MRWREIAWGLCLWLTMPLWLAPWVLWMVIEALIAADESPRP